MAKFFDSLNDELCDFIGAQKLFFVATAPDSGRINLSPKGMNTFRCFDDKTVGYLDLTGSGNETAAHCLENGRMTVMFCSFDYNPLILRLYGRGRVVLPQDSEWQALFSHFEDLPGRRQIILLDIESVQTSCGYAVPQCDSMVERPTLLKWAQRKGKQGVGDYWQEKNQYSIDGLPTPFADETAIEEQ